jgi:DNA-binding GntR family transcriptional regulator
MTTLGIGPIERIKRLSAPQAAAQAIREAIVTGVLKPGERLVEQKMAASLGIGQPTIREALKELEYQGIVRKLPHRGTYVAELSRNDYRRISEVRIALESLAVENAARNLTSEAEAKLRASVEEMEAAAQTLDIATWNRADEAFHRVVWALADNSYLSEVLEAMMFRLSVFAGAASPTMGDWSAAVRQHWGILEGLCSRDPAEARRAFVSHTAKLWNDFLLTIPENNT